MGATIPDYPPTPKAPEPTPETTPETIETRRVLTTHRRKRRHMIRTPDVIPEQEDRYV